MEKKKTPLWARFLTWFIGLLLINVVLVAGVCIFVRVKYDVSLINLVSQIKILNEKVDVEKIAPNPYCDQDYEDMMVSMSSFSEDFITYDSEEGYDVNYEDLVATLTTDLKFTDRQIAALLDCMLKKNEDASATLGEETINLKDFGFKIVQIEFSNFESGNIDFNVVAKFDTKIIKDKIKGFPMNILERYIPSSFYFSSNIRIEKTGVFSYTTHSNSLSINNLSVDETKELFDVVTKFTDNDFFSDFNLTIGNAFVDILIGSETKPGMAYSLKDVGATDYAFEEISDVIYFVVKH